MDLTPGYDPCPVCLARSETAVVCTLCRDRREVPAPVLETFWDSIKIRDHHQPWNAVQAAKANWAARGGSPWH
jgi:hypothetical protein